MEIIDNIGLPSKSNPGLDPWLEELLDKVKVLGQKCDFVVRLEAERRPKSIVYFLENSHNKTQATIVRKGDSIKVETFKRTLPDPENVIKPEFVLETAGVFKRAGGLDDAAQMLVAVMAADTAYSNKTATRIKVYHSPPPDDPWCFSGGQIIAITNDWKNDAWLLRVGADVAYSVPKLAFGRQVPKLFQYVVMSDNLRKVALVMSTEFNFYYEMAECACATA